jgi:polysaccharide pyruvyl transferase WcaK-like protein
MFDIILYGAFDRHNYGDLLFPLIMNRVIQQEFPEKKVVIAGLINSDLSVYGAHKTVSISKALQSSNADAVVLLAGGDVIACDWQSACGYLLPKRLTPFYQQISYHFPKTTDYIISRFFGLTSELPFNINRSDIGPFRKVIYNSVGATEVSEVVNNQKMLSLKQVINEASYISVRDTFSVQQLERINCPSPNLVPDSATVMSLFISPEELEQKSSSGTKKLIKTFNEGYIVFQISQAHVRGKEALFAKELAKASKKLKVPLVFIAIGNAAGHNDSAGINNIVSFLANDIVYDTYLDGNISDLMNIIRNASCYCGTSLHGLITSMSFAVPRVALLPSLRKQINYMDTWDLPHMPRGIVPKELTAAVEIAMATPKSDLENLGDKLGAIYMENFMKMSMEF